MMVNDCARLRTMAKQRKNEQKYGQRGLERAKFSEKMRKIAKRINEGESM